MPSRRKKSKNWVKDVTTTTIIVPVGTMTRAPSEIARILLAENSFPGAPGSIIRFIQFYLNRAGESLPPERRAILKRAQEIVRRRIRLRTNSCKR